MRIGIVGYSARKFNEELATQLIKIGCLSCIQELDDDGDIVIVSGLTDVGVPALAYRLAKEEGWKTAGIACSKAEEYDCFDVDEKQIVGDDWGDESETFLKDIDCMVRVGGGNQSFEEVEAARDKSMPVFEYDLPEIKD